MFYYYVKGVYIMNNTINTQQNIEVYEHDIYYLIDEYIEKYNIQDLKKESQNIWNSVLLYINKNLFKIDNSYLCKDNKTIMNGYNIDHLNEILDIYINACYLYEKEISILGFCKLTGLSQETIFQWGNNVRQLSSNASEIYKKLTVEREETLSNMLISGKRNPVGILGSLNRHYGWNMGQPKGIDGSKAQIGFNDLPTLGANTAIIDNNQQQSIEKLT